MQQVAKALLVVIAVGIMAACGKGSGSGGQTDSYVPPHPDASMYAAPPPMQTENPSLSVPSAGAEVRVGFLVPQSGASAQMGQALLDAGMLALFDKYSTMPAEEVRAQVVLIPKDTEGTPKGAAKAAHEAIEEGARLLIGPLFSDGVMAAAPVAAQAGVPIITFSNNREVAEKGVFLFGFMPEQQVERVLEEAFVQHKARVGALLPANAYGHMVADTVRKMTALYNKPLVGIEFYQPGTENMDNEIQRLTGGRIAADGKPPLDVLLLAEGGQRLQKILARLATFGVTNGTVKLAGTGVWDDPETATTPEAAGGWFASSPLKSYRGFEQRFKHNYGYLPPRLASLAYDAVALAATLAQSPSGPDFSLTALTDPSGYSGPANGIFRLGMDGICTRGLAVLEVGRGDFREIAPAPRSFTP